MVQLAGLMLAGAIVNVAVAWGCATWISGDFIVASNPEVYFKYRLLTSPPHRVHALARIRPGISKWFVEWVPEDHYLEWLPHDSQHAEDRALMELPNWFLNTVRALIDSRSSGDDVVIDARGWPCVCAYSIADLDNNRIISGIGIAPEDESKKRWFMNNFALPLTPIWPNFAINTVFYAAILWVLFFVPCKMRRTLRRRHGLCPACAYPIGSSPVCTECGRAIG